MKTYLITGGAGFIGSSLSEQILKIGHKVIVIDNFNDFYDYRIKIENILEINKKNNFLLSNYKKQNIKILKDIVDSEYFKLEYVDIRDFNELDRVFTENNIDIVIHLAGLGGVRPSIQNPLLYEDVNVKGTNNILEIMRQHRLTKLLAASSSSVYGNNKNVPFKETDIVDFSISPYAASKKANEVLAYTYHHLFHIDVIMLRFFTVFGPRQRPDLAIYKFTKLITENKQIPFFGNGSTSRDYTYIDDIIKGILLLANYIQTHKSIYEITNIGGNTPISLIEMVKTIEVALNKKAKINYLPMQPGDVNRTYADLTKINKLVGYIPDNSFEEGISKFVQWYNIKRKEN